MDACLVAGLPGGKVSQGAMEIAVTVRFMVLKGESVRDRQLCVLIEKVATD